MLSQPFWLADRCHRHPIAPDERNPGQVNWGVQVPERQAARSPTMVPGAGAG